MHADPALTRRAWLAGAGMAAAAGLAAWARPVAVPRAQPLELERIVPRAFGDWRTDRVAELLVRPPAANGKVLGLYDQVLERIYVAPDRVPVMVCIAWGSEQSAGLQAHRPEVCYPSSGYVVKGIERVTRRLAGRELPVTRLHARLGPRSEPVSYWMLLGDQVVADDLQWRTRQLAHGLRGRVLDGMLVRLSTLEPDGPGAYERHAAFADELLAAMEPAAREVLLGRA